MTLKEYKLLCSEYVHSILEISDLLDESDPYGIAEEMEDAFKDQIDHKTFINEAFSNDIKLTN